MDLDHNADAGDWIKGRGRALRRSDVVPEFNPQSYPPLQEFWEVGLKVEAGRWQDVPDRGEAGHAWGSSGWLTTRHEPWIPMVRGYR